MSKPQQHLNDMLHSLAYATVPGAASAVSGEAFSPQPLAAAAPPTARLAQTQPVAVAAAMAATVGETLHGTVGNDTLNGGAGNDHIHGYGGNDQLYGHQGNDQLYGGAGHDKLDGGGGADRLEGGEGNDHYHVNHKNDRVIEKANEGIDTVFSSIDYRLGAHLERLTLTGTANLKGYGNAGNNLLKGNRGHNTLDGGAGADRMEGGQGNDHYHVDHKNDQVIEKANEGIDTVFAGVNHVLAEHVERLTLTGTANLNGYGNDGHNLLIGNSGHNTLKGGKGNDRLEGGGGNDRLYGGAGHDKLYGGNGEDTLEGGGGNDMLDGGEGEDCYVFSGQFGQDRISDVHQLYGWNGGSNSIVLPEHDFDDIRSTSQKSGADSVDLLLQTREGHQILVENQYAMSLHQLLIDRLQLAHSAEDGMGELSSYITGQLLRPGSTIMGDWGEDTLQGKADWADVLSGLDGNDVLHGKEGNDTLIGGRGDDQLLGGAGNDAYVFGRQFNQDIVTDLASTVEWGGSTELSLPAMA